MINLKNKFMLGFLLLTMFGCLSNMSENNSGGSQIATKNNCKPHIMKQWWQKGAKLNSPYAECYLSKINQAEFAVPANELRGLQIDIIGKDTSAPKEIRKHIEHLEKAPQSFVCSERTGICRLSENLKGFAITGTIYSENSPYPLPLDAIIYDSQNPLWEDAKLNNIDITFSTPKNSSLGVKRDSKNISSLQKEISLGIKYLIDNELIPFKYDSEIEQNLFTLIEKAGSPRKTFDAKGNYVYDSVNTKATLAIQNGLVLTIDVGGDFTSRVILSVFPEEYE